MRFWIFLSFIFFLCPVAGATPPDLPKPTQKQEQLSPNTISMPWNTFISLWEKAKDREAKRNIPYAYGKALYMGKSIEAKGELFVQFDLSLVMRSYGDDEKLVPFLPSSINLESVTVDEEPSIWTEKDGSFQVLLMDENEHVLHATFSVKLDSQDWPRVLSLPVIPIPQSEIVLNVPEKNRDATLSPGVSVEPVVIEGGAQLQGFFPATSKIVMTWFEARASKNKLPLKMKASVYQYASLQEGGALGQILVNFQVLEGETNNFNIILPSYIGLVEVREAQTFNKVAQWYSEDQGDSKLLHVITSYKQEQVFKLLIKYETSQPADSYSFEFPKMIPQNIESQENFYALGSTTSLQINESKNEGVEKEGIQNRPEDLKILSKEPPLFYYKAKAPKHQLVFEVKAHKAIPLVGTRIEQALADTIVAESGASITKLTYQVKNNQAQFLKLKLPGHTRLLSASLDGRDIEPASDENYLLLPLIKSVEKSHPLEIIFQSELGRLRMMGHRQLHLPETDVQISELTWNVYSPKAYPVLFARGNVERIRDGLDNLFLNLKKIPNPLFAKLYAIDKTHLRFEVPFFGIPQKFESYLIQGKAPTLHFYFICAAFHKVLVLILSLFFFISLFWTLSYALEKAHMPEFFVGQKKYLWTMMGFATVIALTQILTLYLLEYWAWTFIFCLAFFLVWQKRQVKKRLEMLSTGWLKTWPSLICWAAYLTGGFFLTLSKWHWIVLSFVSGIFLNSFIDWIAPKVFVSKLKLDSHKEEKSELTFLPLIFIFFMLMGAGYGAFAATNASEFESVEKLDRSQVNVVWSVVEDILNKIEEKEKREQDELGLGYIFGDSTVGGRITKRAAEISLAIPLKVLSKDYVKIPLFSEGVIITDAALDGESLALNRENGQIFFEARKTGLVEAQILELQLMIPVEEKGGVKEFILESPILKGGIIELGFGDEVQSILIHDAIWQKQEKKIMKAALGTNQKLDVEYAVFQKAENVNPDKSSMVQKIYAESGTLASFEENKLNFMTTIHFRVLNTEMTGIVFQLGSTASVSQVKGKGISGWLPVESSEGLTTYTVQTQYPLNQDFDLSIEYFLPVDETVQEINLPPFVVTGVARHLDLMGIEMKENAELVPKKIEKVRLVDGGELPEEVTKAARLPLVYALRSMEHPFTAVFLLHRYDPVELDEALIDRAHFTSVISPDGKVVTQASLVIRNTTKQFLTMELPHAQVLNSYLDGQPVKPSEAKKGVALFPVRRQGDNPFLLEIVYENEEVMLSPLGGLIRLRFPKFDLPSSLLLSDVYAPEKLSLFKPHGDLSETKASFVSTTRTVPLKIALPTRGKKLSTKTSGLKINQEIILGFFYTSNIIYVVVYYLVLVLFLLVGYQLACWRHHGWFRKCFLVFFLLAFLALVTIPLLFTLGSLGFGIILFWLRAKIISKNEKRPQLQWTINKG